MFYARLNVFCLSLMVFSVSSANEATAETQNSLIPSIRGVCGMVVSRMSRFWGRDLMTRRSEIESRGPKVIGEFRVLRIPRRERISTASVVSYSSVGREGASSEEVLNLTENLLLKVGVIENPNAEESLRAFVFVERSRGGERFALGALSILTPAVGETKGRLRYVDEPHFIRKLEAAGVFEARLYEMTRSFEVALARKALMVLKRKFPRYFWAYSDVEFSRVFPWIY